MGRKLTQQQLREANKSVHKYFFGALALVAVVLVGMLFLTHEPFDTPCVDRETFDLRHVSASLSQIGDLRANHFDTDHWEYADGRYRPLCDALEASGA